MLKLLKLEFSKFKKSTVVIMLSTMFLVFFPFSLAVGKIFDNFRTGLPTSDAFFQFTTIWEYLGYAGNWMVFFFLGVVMIYMVTLEVTHKTMRQSIIAGLSRNEFFLSKLYIALFISILATIYYTIIALTIGFINTPNPTLELAITNEWAIPRFFLMSFGYMTFAMMVGFIVRSSGLAVFLYLSFVLMIEKLIRYGHMELIGNKFTKFYPMKSIGDLMPLPLLKMADYIKTKDFDFSLLLSYKTASILSIIFILMFVGLSYISFTKRDL